MAELLNLAAAEQVVDDSFIAQDRASKEALKSATILKNIDINVLIVGDMGVGKRTLAKYITQSPIINGEDNMFYIDDILSRHSRVIVKNFDKIKNFDLFERKINHYKTKIIATSRTELSERVVDKFFTLKIKIPPLIERKKDIIPIARKFFDEAKKSFGIDISFDMNESDFDLSKNCYSLKYSIYKKIVMRNICEKDLIEIAEKILYDKIGTNDDYKSNLYLYEIPLIKAGFKKFGSQLKISEKFGINRNTLRKKINLYDINGGKRYAKK